MGGRRTFNDVFDGDDLERLGRLDHDDPLEADQRCVLTPLDYTKHQLESLPVIRETYPERQPR